MNRRYEELPENINELNDQEIDALAQNIWQKITVERNSIDRDTQLKLRQRAYAIWIKQYPHENDDDPDCHLEEIYSGLVKEHNPHFNMDGQQRS